MIISSHPREGNAGQHAAARSEKAKVRAPKGNPCEYRLRERIRP